MTSELTSVMMTAAWAWSCQCRDNHVGAVPGGDNDIPPPHSADTGHDNASDNARDRGNGVFIHSKQLKASHSCHQSPNYIAEERGK